MDIGISATKELETKVEKAVKGFLAEDEQTAEGEVSCDECNPTCEPEAE